MCLSLPLRYTHEFQISTQIHLLNYTNTRKKISTKYAHDINHSNQKHSHVHTVARDMATGMGMLDGEGGDGDGDDMDEIIANRQTDK